MDLKAPKSPVCQNALAFVVCFRSCSFTRTSWACACPRLGPRPWWWSTDTHGPATPAGRGRQGTSKKFLELRAVRTINRVIESEKPLQVLSRRSNMIGFVFLKHRLTAWRKQEDQLSDAVPDRNSGSVGQRVAEGIESSMAVCFRDRVNQPHRLEVEREEKRRDIKDDTGVFT